MMLYSPPMGWNSWNTFGPDINEKLIFEMADCLAENGFLEAGYQYLVLDDCWSKRDRDSNGKLVPDPEKFPHGMKHVADYIHSRNLKFGMYSCAGNMTCAGFPGSAGHEFTDAETFASWGADFLKYDYCYHSDVVHGKYLYRRMGLALENCGRDIAFSACTWGKDDTGNWIKETGASCWRSSGDIFDNWTSITSLIREQESLLPLYSSGCYNDMDMLVVGMYGKGNVGLGGCSDVQYRTHFSCWALLGSPLMIGCNLRNITPETRKTLLNQELIRINQDPGAKQPVKLKGILDNPDLVCYYRQLSGGEIALGFFNLGEDVQIPRITLDEIGLSAETGRTLILREVWTDQLLAPKNDVIYTFLRPYDCAVYRCKLVRKDEVPEHLRNTVGLEETVASLKAEGFRIPN